MASVDRLYIDVRGKGGHGGMPHLAADPVVAAAHIVIALQTIVSRNVNPVDVAVVTIGAIHGGDAFNVIPDLVSLKGTIRTFDRAFRNSMPERIRRIAEGVASAFGCTAEVVVNAGNPAVINDPGGGGDRQTGSRTRRRRRARRRAHPHHGRRGHGGLLRACSGLLRLHRLDLTQQRGLTAPHHSPRFDFDEDALAIGCAFLVEAAEEALRT